MERIRVRLRKMAALHVGTAVIVAAVLWLTLAPHPVGEKPIFLFPGADKIVHALMFFTLAATFLAEEYILGRLSVRKVWPAVLATALFGALTEFLQDIMHAGRAFEWSDMVADSIGAFAAAVLALYQIYKSRSTN